MTRATRLLRPWLFGALLLGAWPAMISWAGAEDAYDTDPVNAEDYFREGGLEIFADHPEPVRVGQGFVAAVDFDGPTVVIAGQVFGFRQDAEVRLQSGFGAPTLLEAGMPVEFYFVPSRNPAHAGAIIALLELPEGALEPS